MKADIGDIVELIRGIPEHRLQAGMEVCIKKIRYSLRGRTA
ncbi:MAG: hypothetical protein Q3M30_01590 [Candidatus Electrothrix sp. Rat3]|nr:hypothetical protein [Candidatus Electrothrix rattekaaiensis]